MSPDRRRGVGACPRPAVAWLSIPPSGNYRTGLTSAKRVWALGVVLLAVALTVSVAGVAVGDSTGSTATVQESGEPPELSGGDRINDTAIRLVFTDDSGVAVDSIGASDFLLSAGEVAGVSVRQSGSNAIVDLRLAKPIDADELTVGLRDGSDVRDVDGNALDASEFVGVTIDGMDGVAPSVRRLDVPEQASDTAEIEVVFDEAVSAFRVRLSGEREAVFTEADFERVRGGKYLLLYEPPADGVYTVEITNATDPAGNTATFSTAASMEVRTTDVRAVAGVDLSDSGGLNLTFDAGRSDERAVAYLWDFDDGETATGERVSHSFTPGNYTVQLEVIDEFGNVGRDEIRLNLTADATAGFGPGPAGVVQPTVSIEPGGSAAQPTTQVSVRAANADEGLLIRKKEPGESLVASETLSVDEMVVTPATDGGFGLGLAVAGPSSELVTAASAAVDGEAVAGFIVRPTITDEAIRNATVRYRVRSGDLGEFGVRPNEVSLYREQGGTWERLETSARGVSDQWLAFESATPGFSRFAVVAPNDDEQASGGENNGGTNGTTENATGEDNGGVGNATNDQFTVRNVTLSETEVEPGETVEIQAQIVNNGSEPGDFVAALARNDSVLETQEVLRIPPDGESLPVLFTRQLNETGTAQFSINGTAAPELSVSGGGGGGLFGFLGFLGVLPLGLLRTLLLFVIAPLAVVFIGLKGAASYLGY